MINIFETYELEQGSEKWHKVRNGRITGTDAYSILKGKSIQEILAQKNNAKPFHGNYYTKRGHILETEAKLLYEEIYSIEIDDAGFITNDKYPQAGYSPDGLISNDGLVECKAFQETKHLRVYKSLDPAIIAQTQFGMFIAERDYCELILYNPDIIDPHKALLIKRLHKIPTIQDKFKKIFSVNP